MTNNLRKRFMDVDDRTEDLRDQSQQHPDIWAEFLRRFDLSWNYHENALEGIVLTHAELTTALTGRPIAPDTYHPIRNLKVAMGMMRREASAGGPITLDLAHRLHDTLGQREPGFTSGRYRKFIPLHRTYFHDIAQPQVIVPRLAKLMEWAVQNDPEDEDAVRFAAHFHHDFMGIFPFPEHTGKVGRLLLNYVLVRHGYMPVIFHGSERNRYYDTLRHSPKEMEAFLIEMMMNCIENGMKFVDKTLEEREKERGRRLVAVR